MELHDYYHDLSVTGTEIISPVAEEKIVDQRSLNSNYASFDIIKKNSPTQTFDYSRKNTSQTMLFEIGTEHRQSIEKDI